MNFKDKKKSQSLLQRLTSYLVGGTTQTLFSWWNYTNEAKKQIEQQQMWKLILEAFKIIHYKDSTVKCQDIYEQTLKLSYIDLRTRYSLQKKRTLLNIYSIIFYVFIN